MAQIFGRAVITVSPDGLGTRRKSLEEMLHRLGAEIGDHDAVRTFRIVEDGGVHVVRENEGRQPSLVLSRNRPLDDRIADEIMSEFQRHLRRCARARQIASYDHPPAWSYDADDLVLDVIASAGMNPSLLAPAPNRSRNYAGLQDGMRRAGCPIGGIADEEGRITVDTISIDGGRMLIWDSREGPGVRVVNAPLPDSVTAALPGRTLGDACDHQHLRASGHRRIIAAKLLATPDSHDLVLQLEPSRSAVTKPPPEVDPSWIHM